MNADSGRLAGRVATAHTAGVAALPATDDAASITGRATVRDGGVPLTGRAG
ncbi:hypothetical protein AB0C15_25105 [Micromonospora sp. NPDC048835]|uniref:hypothetical protein n=1 Tax=Micromonospora sp. NPDC048835 TaxID=3155147 RepID=UPI0033E81C4A